MKNKILITLMLVLTATVLWMGFAHAQTATQATIDIARRQAIIATDNNDIALDNTDIANRNADIIIQQAGITQDNAIISQYNYANAQTPAQVNWSDIDNLEIAGIRYTQWQAARSGENWPNIITLLAVGGCTTESAVNWNNFNTCVANGVNMNQPVGNWPYGFSAFWCGNGSIQGTC